jgi:hypothetical protein
MAKKSRDRAAKYSELSRARRRKRKQLSKGAPEAKATLISESQPKEPPEIVAPKEAASKKVAAASPAKSATSKAAQKTQSERKIAIPGFQYVKGDLKRVGILAGAIIVILIILAVVLG